jgi:putative hemolysin
MLGTGIVTEAAIILLLVLVNGLFAMSEIAVISARKTRLRQRAAAGDDRARRALELAEHPNRFLSTAQIGITLIGIFAGAYGGANVAVQVDAWLQRFPALAPFSEQLALGAVVLAITFLSLVLGELVPKRIALTYPERIASAVAGPMHALSIVAYPLVRLLGAATDLVLRALRVHRVEEPAVTEEEITAMIRLGTEIGVFEPTEQDLVERVFRLGDLSAATLMTGRERIVWLDLLDPLEVNREKMIEHRVQRFLVCEGTLDNLLGMVAVTELWARMLAGQSLDLRAAIDAPLRVEETEPALRLLERFRTTGMHLALVLDARGSIAGLVTLTDVLNQLSGDFPRAGEPMIIRRDDGSWLLDGALPMQEVWSTLGAEARDDGTDAAPTLGTWVVERLRRVPISGEFFESGGYRFEVMDMDGTHVDKVLVSRGAGEAEGASRGHVP